MVRPDSMNRAQVTLERRSYRSILARLLQDPALDRKSQRRITHLPTLVYDACNEGMIGR